ncbi:MAG: hypothetical protein B6D53_04110 [Candidatus Omnitrophica bacterium 4484_49]|nr:MAG: hypothetical protein B6D53_04110 [Candidatus Omnitrophica bacterium 4484_49]
MNLIVTESPHLKASLTTRRMMWEVVIALLPVIFVSWYLYSWDAIRVILISLITCLITEWIFLKLRNRTPDLLDGSAVVTAILFALIMPPESPNWLVALGAFFGIVFGKQVFGGLGYNIFNPALIGRAFLMAAYPTYMTTWSYPRHFWGKIDGLTCATPLGLAKFSHVVTPVKYLFLGNVGGSLGETSALAIIIGGFYLLIRRVIDWRIPVSILLTVSILSLFTWIIAPQKYFSPLFHLFAGGLMLGAFFMATDPVTTPVTKLGRIIFGIGVGILVFVIRNWGGLPEGVMYSILIMNGFTPLINRVTIPKRFGK